jgi:hypothetical protein
MTQLYAVSAVLKVAAAIDAFRTGAPHYWFLIILLVPFGEVGYFAFLKLPGVGMRLRRQRVVPLATLRHAYDSTPCLENEVRLAGRLYDGGEFGEARELYERALVRDPEYKRALYGLALCQAEAAQHERAAATLEKLIDLDRAYAEHGAYLRLAEVLQCSGQGERAAELLAELVRAAPRIEHHLALAEAQLAVGRPIEARQTLETSLEDYKHAPRFIRRLSKPSARRAGKMLASIQPTA